MINLKQLAHQKDYEKLVFVLRRHWIILVGHIAILLLEIILPIALVIALQPLVIQLLAHPLIGPALLLLVSAYTLTILLLFFHNFIDYYLDVWVVTNERLINVEQHGLFSRVVAEIRYYRIQDVASEMKGILPTLFQYGNVTVQTAGTQPRFTMQQVPNPHAVARHIHALLEEDHHYHIEKQKEENVV